MAMTSMVSVGWTAFEGVEDPPFEPLKDGKSAATTGGDDGEGMRQEGAAPGHAPSTAQAGGDGDGDDH
jgi:hypothetical protein